jgi:hypothetical protein
LLEDNKDELVKRDKEWMEGFEVDVVETFFEEWPENDSDS